MRIELKPGESVTGINEYLRIIQSESSLKFGTDSYLLSAFIGKKIKGEACDLGAGSGVISLFAAARTSFEKVHAVEINEASCDLIVRNAALNGLSEKIECIGADVRDIKEKFAAESMSAVFSNPPYMRAGSGKESSDDAINAARRECNGTVADFVVAASYLLKFGGRFYCVFRPERVCELIHSMKCNSLEPKRIVNVYPDAKSAPCLVLIEAKRGAAPDVKIARPLIIYGEGDSNVRKYTEDMERVYRDFSLDFLFE